MSFGICAIFKNEARYLREWVEFHLLVGAETFLLYDNNSDDNWRSELAPYMREGYVSVQPWRTEPGQLSAYVDALQHHIEYDLPRWMAFIDIDEFLYSPTGLSVPEILRAHGEDFDGACGVGVNWRVYGTDGQHQPSDDLVTTTYLAHAERDDPINTHVKAIVRPERCQWIAHDPHHFFPNSRATPMVNTIGLPCNGPFNAPPLWDRLVINHYMSKSFEEARRKAQVRRSDTGELRSIDHLTNPALSAGWEYEIVTLYEAQLRARLAARERP